MYTLMGDKPIKGLHAYHPTLANPLGSPSPSPQIDSTPPPEFSLSVIDPALYSMPSSQETEGTDISINTATPSDEPSNKRKFSAISSPGTPDPSAPRFPTPDKSAQKPRRVRASATLEAISDFQKGILELGERLLAPDKPIATPPRAITPPTQKAGSNIDILDQPTPKRKRIAISHAKEQETYLSPDEYAQLVDHLWDVPGAADRYNMLEDDVVREAWVRRRLE
jgi:hypothetical protein